MAENGQTYLMILLAEDNLGDIMLVQRALEKHRIAHRLYVVRDGAEALAFVDRIGQPGAPCPDVVLLDLNLPKVDGRQVLTEFRKHPGCLQAPVIVVSSSDAPRDRTRMAELGIARYFRKPLDFEGFLQLGAVVREVVEAAPGGSC
jgi:chemotaxis family two-component system response regulator Rcp1